MNKREWNKVLSKLARLDLGFVLGYLLALGLNRLNKIVRYN